ncbi:MAG: GntR family transcriptional regulator [Lachnospiraceae bacterium]|nr:GntR family transcriptional regulator [Lachnospiraceae bacterium]
MIQLKRIKSESVVQQIIDSLVEAMIRKELKPGDQIPTEMELAERLGVGRNSVREAIKILVYFGVLEIRRAEGTYVCEGFTDTMIDPIIYGIILDKAGSYEYLMELREIMEAGVMKLAMENAKEEEFRNLRIQLERMRREIEIGPENVDRVFQEDNEFHSIITSMGHNPLVQKIEAVVRTLTHSMRYETVKAMVESGRGQELYEAHEKLLRILESKDESDLNENVRNTYFVNEFIEAKELARQDPENQS